MAELVDITLPEGQQEGTTSVVSNWFKKAGDPVSEHEPIAEMETDKVVVEIAAPASGIMAEILKWEGEAVEPGDVLARIDATGGDTTAEPGQDVPVLTDIAESDPETQQTNGRHKLSPMVRRMVKQHDLNPDDIPGTGKGGRITAGDIHKHLEAVGKSGPKTIQCIRPVLPMWSGVRTRGLAVQHV